MSDIGYKKPPVAHQFKPGVSGNPEGGKRGPRKEKVRAHPFDEKRKIRVAKKIEEMTVGTQLVMIARNMAVQKPELGLSKALRAQHKRIYQLSKKKGLGFTPFREGNAEWAPGDALVNSSDAVQHLGIGRLLRPYTKKPRMVLEPFIVQTALDRMEPNQLTRDEQRRVIDTTRKAWKLDLPHWWAPDIRETKRATLTDD